MPKGNKTRKKNAYRHPRTGEQRRVRQPLKLDKVSSAMRSRIARERASGKTWTQIEALSPTFHAEWAKSSDAARAQFPGLRIPHSTLQRWHDLRVEQEKRAAADSAKVLRAISGLRLFIKTAMQRTAKRPCGKRVRA